MGNPLKWAAPLGTQANNLYFDFGLKSTHHSYETLRTVPPYFAQINESLTKAAAEHTELVKDHQLAVERDDRKAGEEVHLKYSRASWHEDLPAHQRLLKGVSSTLDSGAESMSNAEQAFANSQKSPAESAVHAMARKAQTELATARGLFSDVVKEMESADGQITFFVRNLPPKDAKQDEVYRWIDSPECAVAWFNIGKSLVAAADALTPVLERLAPMLTLDEMFADATPVTRGGGDGQRAQALAILQANPGMSVGAVAALGVETLFAAAGEAGSATIADHYRTILSQLAEPATDAHLEALAIGETAYWDKQPGWGKRVSAAARYGVLKKCRDDAMAKMEPATRKQWEDFLAADRLKHPATL